MATVENKTSNQEEHAFHGVAEGKDSIAFFGQGAAVGVRGDGSTWHGVAGISTSTTGGHGVYGEGHTGVGGVGLTWIGVYGETRGTENGPAGVWGEGREGGSGVKGHARAQNAAGVAGYHLAEDVDGGAGVLGESMRGHGVRGDGVVGVSGVGRRWIGVYGETDAPTEVGAAGVWGEGKETGDGVKGHANGPGKAAVVGIHLSTRGPGVFGRGNPAGLFEGNVVVTGDLILAGADVAEQFDVVSDDGDVRPGSVVVLDSVGRISTTVQPYDTRVAGIVSGAGDRAPALVLDRESDGVDSAASASERQPLAVVGKAWCLADATGEPIRVGDLLTTARRAGHAMRATSRVESIGAVIGKALTPLERGVVSSVTTSAQGWANESSDPDSCQERS
jgi:hypothetical protein